jgi:hypothetical protein
MSGVERERVKYIWKFQKIVLRRQYALKCYVCAQKGKDVEAVATCVICGMGVCMEHALRRELVTWEHKVLYKTKAKTHRILCPDDAAAFVVT